jgi:hypothetical protein
VDGWYGSSAVTTIRTMSDIDDVREIALALPEATEQDHHGMVSFRVHGRIFATLPDDDHVRVMVDETEIRAAVAEHPRICSELYWGTRLACVVVTLPTAPHELLHELLAEAWLRKAPKSLARRFDLRIS